MRRYRSPVADAAMRQKEMPRPERRPFVRPRDYRVDENGTPVNESPVGSLGSRDEDPAMMHGAIGWDERRHDDRGEASHGHNRHPRYNHQSHRSEAPERAQQSGARNDGRSQTKGHKSRVSFDLPSSIKDDDDDDETDEESSIRGGSERTRASLRDRGEAYDICRRMWEMMEPASVAG